MNQREYGTVAAVPEDRHAGGILMPVATGLVSIEPWDTIEWVSVKFGLRPDTYRIMYNNDELFTVHATIQEDLLNKINVAWRKKFPEK
jgi:hypothetical protein